MIKNQQINWKEFRIEEIFEITGTITTHPSILKVNGKTPRITCAATDNGLDGFYQNKPTEKGNVLTIDSATNGFVSYQEMDFLATDHVEKLIFKGEGDFNRYVGLFIKSCIDSAKGNKFGYGYKFSQCRIRRQTIMLPAKNGKPDYAYMEAYMRNAEKLLLKRYKDYLVSVMPSQEPERLSMDGKRWKSFNINVVFPMIQRGKRLKTEDHIIGITPYVSSSSMLNGVDNFISNTNGVRRFKNCLTIANSGSVGEAFYQPFEFVASDHVTKLENPLFDKYVYLFIATVVKRLSEKYSFNREINDSRIRREMIMLPVNEKGAPDYAFMSAYMKRLEYDILVAYIKKKS